MRHRANTNSLGLLAAAAFTLLLAWPVHAQERVPANLALQLMLKIVTYDQGFADRGSGDFVVLVPNSPAESAGFNEAMAAAKAMPPKIQNRNLRFVPVTWEQVATTANEQNASAVLLVNGATPAQATAAAQIATNKKLYSLALDPELVEKGAMIGVGAKDGKPQVVIHLTTAKDSGVNFPTTVLKIARTVK